MANTYYHNPKCSKSRAGLELLQKSNLSFDIKEYLSEPFTKNELLNILSKLKAEPLEIIRTKEPIYSDLKLSSKNLNIDEWADILIDHPKLFERPVFVTENSAVVGRPTEKLKKFIENL